MEGRRTAHHLNRPAGATFPDQETEKTLTPTTTPTDTSPIDAATLRSWVERHDELVVIDVRGAAEFESLHIRGSYHVPLPLLREHAPEFAAYAAVGGDIVRGAGLIYSAATNSCVLGRALSWMPWNRSATEPTVRQALEQLSSRS